MFFQVLQLTKHTDNLGQQNASITINGTSNSHSSPVAFIPIEPKSNLDQNCDDNLCFNGGYCDPMTQMCKCRGHFIGNNYILSILIKY